MGLDILIFGPRSPKNCRVLCKSDSLSSVWGYSMHCKIFPMLKFSKKFQLLPHFSSNFRFQRKAMRKLATMLEYRPSLFLAIGPVLKFCGILKI